MFVPVHRVLPMNMVAEDALSHACLVQYLTCRQSIAKGLSIGEVLGDERMDVTALVAPETLLDMPPFTQWVFNYVEILSVGRSLTWTFRLAYMHCVFHLMRVSTAPQEGDLFRSMFAEHCITR